jgi:hypothetical protein
MYAMPSSIYPPFNPNTSPNMSMGNNSRFHPPPAINADSSAVFPSQMRQQQQTAGLQQQPSSISMPYPQQTFPQPIAQPYFPQQMPPAAAVMAGGLSPRKSYVIENRNGNPPNSNPVVNGNGFAIPASHPSATQRYQLQASEQQNFARVSGVYDRPVTEWRTQMVVIFSLSFFIVSLSLSLSVFRLERVLIYFFLFIM